MHAATDFDKLRSSLPPLSQLTQDAGYELKRKGSKHFICCPFHSETNPSCLIDSEKNRYHCFGCGAKGDSLDFLAHHRGISLPDLIKSLSNSIGIPHLVSHNRPKPAPIKQESVLAPFTEQKQEAWNEACMRLQFNAQEIERIAAWRGISPDAIRYVASKRYMGLWPYYGTVREAFLVSHYTDAFHPVSIHVRLAPHTSGNQHGKASWRYDPPGPGAWPFILGDLASAEYIFITEGQWDAIALASIMGWHDKWPKTTAVIGLRGATSGTKISALPIHPKAIVFAIADADNAGKEWFTPNSFLNQLSQRVQALHAFWPSIAKADLNDVIKSGLLDRSSMLEIIKKKLPLADAKKNYPTFLQWLLAHSSPTSTHHAAYTTMSQAPSRIRRLGRAPLYRWQSLWKKHFPEESVILLTAAFHDYVKYR